MTERARAESGSWVRVMRDVRVEVWVVMRVVRVGWVRRMGVWDEALGWEWKGMWARIWRRSSGGRERSVGGMASSWIRELNSGGAMDEGVRSGLAMLRSVESTPSQPHPRTPLARVWTGDRSHPSLPTAATSTTPPSPLLSDVMIGSEILQLSLR